MNKFAMFGLGLVVGFATAIAVQTIVVKLKETDKESEVLEEEEPVNGKVVNSEARFRSEENDDSDAGDAREDSENVNPETVRKSEEAHEYGDPEYFEHRDTVLFPENAWPYDDGLVRREEYETYVDVERADGQFLISYDAYLRERLLQKSPYTEILLKYRQRDQLLFMDQDGTVLEPYEQFPEMDVPKMMKIQDEMPLIIMDTTFCYMYVVENIE